MTDFRLTPQRVRELTGTDLGYTPAVPPTTTPPNPWAALDPIPDDDPILKQTVDLLERFGGVIFTGPPGTSKSWYAARIAVYLTDGGDRNRMRVLQFHPSYQYEDFVEGFVPTAEGFEQRDKHLLLIAERARTHPAEKHVILIDELSRGEPGRIFGEALTYVEKSKRDFPFLLSSGQEVSLPKNLIFLATMNPLDRGVDEVDAAFERRFAKIALDPNDGILATFLSGSGMDPQLAERVIEFFREVNRRALVDNPLAALGHTFFIGVTDEIDLQALWDHQLRFLFDKAFRLDPDGLEEVRRHWDRVLQPPPAAPPTPPAPLPAPAPAPAAET
ncbi:MAG TPA: AAA family ATPase [Ilumatobacter sp.]|nr:AAA family ATPase [Ilumatobacter sp.]